MGLLKDFNGNQALNMCDRRKKKITTNLDLLLVPLSQLNEQISIFTQLKAIDSKFIEQYQLKINT